MDSDRPANDDNDRPRPGRQTRSTDELRERIDFTAKLLARRLVKSDIKRVLKQKYGCSARTCEVYLSRAREVVRRWTRKSRRRHKVDAIAFYESIIQSDAHVRDRILAQTRIDALIGSDAPQKHRHEGSLVMAVVEEVSGAEAPHENGQASPRTNGVPPK